MVSKHLVVVGVGGFGREVICWAENAACDGAAPPIRGYLLDDGYPLLSAAYGLAWLGGLDAYVPICGDVCVVAVSDPVAKRQIVSRLQARGATFTSLVHPSAVIAKTAVLGVGCIVCPQSLLSADVTLGDFITVNAMSSIGHDSKIGAFTTLSAHVDITGRVTVGESAFFGSGARVLPGLTVGNEAKVGAGAVVMRSICAGVTVYTNPARKLN
jgi:sugar O-acyltransferase (sialic acid O-acetyltransferase NeuD family)